MNIYMFMMSITISVIKCQTWQFVSEDLIDYPITETNWGYNNAQDFTQGAGSQMGSCTTNTISYIYVAGGKSTAVYSTSNIIPHYQIKVVVDGYFLDANAGTISISYGLNPSSTTYSLSYKDNGGNGIQSYQAVCSTSYVNFEIQTFVMTFVHNEYTSMQFRVSGTTMGTFKYGTRGLQIFASPCHWSCLKCDNAASTGCRACYANPTTILGSASSCSTCPTNTAYIEYLDVDKKCVTECHYYRVADSNKVCQFNENMLPFQTLFSTNTFSVLSPGKFIPDSINFNLDPSEKVNTIPCLSTYNYVGSFYQNEGVQYTLSLPYNISYIRFRITILKFGSWADNSAIRILLDSTEFASIYTTSQVFSLRNAIQLYLDTNCTGTVTYYRFETKMRTNFTNPILYIMGNMDTSSSQSWGFRDITMDIMKCQSSCSWCDFDLKCYACSTGYLYKNRCVPTCPPYSTVSGTKCTDFDQATDNLRYIIKAFYDSQNTTDVDVANIVGPFTNITNNNNFKTTDHQIFNYIPIFFSYYLKRRVLGGPLVWNNAYFQQTYTLNPHYQFNVKFTVVLGDSFQSQGTTGDFRYTFGGYAETTLSYSSATPVSVNTGGTAQDRYITVDTTLAHTATSFVVKLTCNSNQSIQNNFCLLYDYYVIIYECTQYCNACTGPSWAQCTSTQALPTGMSSPTTCVDNTYYYDTSVTPAVCTKCTPTYCLECTSSVLCTKCATNFYLSNGQCLCTPSTYLSGTTCSACNSLCKTCYGASSSNCLSCYDSQHRQMNKNTCTCQNNYYDDGVNVKCQSVCGDMVATDGEDCDDGNTIRFDGCNNCKFECQKECSVCVSGKCQQCITGYFLHSTMKKCYPKCGDNIIVSQEQCEDNNLTQYDGCYSCQFQCQSQCINCVSGICQSCDSSIGYYINSATNRCETQCGDMIIAGTEICDDGNLNPFDGCHNCQLQCDIFCSVCIKGICQKCQSGYQLISNNKCLSICGDKIVTYYESCDDGNLIKYDGCNQCKFQCQDECTNCLVGTCVECNTSGFYLNQSKSKCLNQCGDGQLTIAFEQCDDSNSLNEDGCYQCKYECQPECLTCTQGLCYQCQSNYYLSQEQKCVPICGDGVIAKQEYCDDKNYIIEDGCQDCRFSCEKTCQDCYLGVCKSCITGYTLNSKTIKCDPICGDSLTIGTEQCDSMILDLNKKNITGCVQCQLQCQPECEVCAQGQCQRCVQSKGWYLNTETGLCESLCGDNLISQYEQCEDQNSQLNDGCSQCYIDCQDECQICNYGICTMCQSGYNLINKICYSICGDGITTSDEECDYGIQQLMGYGCVNCKYKCEEGCNYCVEGICYECKNDFGWYFNEIDQKCSTECGDAIVSGIEMCDETSTSCQSCQFQCNDYCQECSFGQCSKCQVGYILKDNDCISVCGDLIVANDEECDDNDLKPFDGCFNCQQQCQNECLNCYKGECIECDVQNGWYLIEKTCLTQYGDGIVAGTEECDIDINLDNGNISLNKCLNCKYKCDDNCIDCHLGTCQECFEGYVLSEDNYCIPQCGMILSQLESICDDGNLDGLDKCYSCQYDCPINCEQCVYGECKNCLKGYRLINYKCESYCGDGYITPDERCDDANNLEFDGCHKCLYSCPQYCLNCIQGICYECQDGFHLEYNYENNYCVTDCKDLMVKQSELKCFVQECQTECLLCFYGQCYQCKIGWHWNDQKLICESICGDDKITDQEECDFSSNFDQQSPLCSNECKLQCPSNCDQCSFGICKKCLKGYYLYNNNCTPKCGDQSIQEIEQCDDDNLNPFDGCFRCNFDCVDNCTVCVDGVCEECEVGYELKENDCLTICGDGIVTKDEQCDEKDISSLALCNQQCKYECPKNCQFCKFGQCIFCKQGFYLKGKECLPICGDGLILGGEYCDDANLEAEDGCFECQYSCQSQCLVCQQGVCLACMEEQGWHLTPQGNCEAYCGDMIVTGNEQCDDGNDANFDGCFNCNYICQVPCTKCLAGSCYECNTPGWRLDNFFCWEICGDGLSVGIEECDDGNDVPYDGCFDCKTQCEEACVSCFAGQCNECAFGWKLTPEHRCEANCGDSYTLPYFEDCDDGNLLPYDGCYECNYQCVKHCTSCEKGICYECNTPGWQYQKETFLCIPVCGDGAVNGNEICDDGNLINYDGCNDQCDYQCHLACIDCQKGICQECDQTNGYFVQNNQCGSQCGDGLWEPTTEQCDDGNLFNNDGCSNYCRVELNWYCESELSVISNCIYRKQPEMVIKSLNQENNKLQLQVKFTAKMMLSDLQITPQNKFQRLGADADYENIDLLNIKIDQLLEIDYTYKIFPIVPIYVEPQDIEYQIEIALLKNIPLEKLNIIVIVDNKIMLSENSVRLIENTGLVTVPVTHFIDPTSASILATLQDYQEFQTYSYLLVSGLNILTSGFSNLFIACDTIQYLYYSKYINIQFPKNLQEFQKNLKLQSIPNRISNYTSSHLIKKDNTTSDNEQMPEKFKDDGLHYDFLQNSLSSLVIASASFSIFFTALGLQNLIHLLRASTINSLGSFFGGILQTISEKCIKVTTDFQYSGAIRVLTVNFYDLAFASLLQLSSYDNQEPQQIIQTVTAASTLLIQAGFIGLLFHKIRQIQTKQSTESKHQIKTLFSHLSNDKSKQFWNMQYNTFLLVKKMVYITLIVGMQKQGLYQTISIALQSSVFTAYLIVSKPISKIDEYRKTLITEVGMFALSLSFVLYSLHEQLQLQQDSLFYLGWINIGIYNTILTSNLLIDTFAQVKILVDKFKKALEKIIQASMPAQSRVQPIFV